jgi:hypothetical protein
VVFRCERVFVSSAAVRFVRRYDHPLEAEQALAWARAHPAWIDDPAPLVVENPYR